MGRLMLKRVFVVFLLVLFIRLSTSAQITIDGHTYADTIHITQSMLPYAATINDRAYVVQEDILAEMQTTGAIYFNDCDFCALISEPGQRYTITLDTNGTGDQSGIRSQNADNLRIRNIRAVAGWARTDTSSSAHRRIFDIRGGFDVKIDSTYGYVTGYGDVDDYSNGITIIYFGDGTTFDSYQHVARACSLWNDCTGFPARQRYPLTAVMIRSEFSDDQIQAGGNREWDFNAKVVDSWIKSAWVGVFGYGRENPTHGGVYVIDSNEFEMAYMNTSNQSFNGSFHGDGGAIGITDAEKIWVGWNTSVPKVDLLADPPIYGGAGGFIANTHPITLPIEPRSEVNNNNFTGWLERDSDHAFGLFVKFGVDNVDFYENTFQGRITPNGYDGQPYGGGAWFMTLNDCKFWDNVYVAVSSDESIPAMGLVMRAMFPPDHTGNVFERDTIKSNSYSMCLYPDYSEQYWGGLQSQTFGDYSWQRVDTATTLSEEGIFYFFGSYELRDITMLNVSSPDGIQDTLIEWSGADSDYQEIEWKRDFEFVAIDQMGNPVNATIQITDNYGHVVHNQACGADGLDTLRAKYWRRTFNEGTDSTGFNPFSYSATFNGEELTGTFNVGATDSTFTFNFTFDPFGGQRNIGYTINSMKWLTSMRPRGGISGDTAAFMPSPNGTSSTHLLLSYDQGQTWQTPSWDYGYDYENHLAAWFWNGSGLHWTGDMAEFNARYFAGGAPYTNFSTDQWANNVTPDPTFDVYMSGIFANGPDSVWFLNQYDGVNIGDPLVLLYTEDYFATAPTSHTLATGLVHTNPDDGNNPRVGLHGDPATGMPIPLWFDGQYGITYWEWEAPVWDSNSVGADEVDGGTSRYYTSLMIDGNHHFAFPVAIDNSIYHYYETSEDVFAKDVISTTANMSAPFLFSYKYDATAVLYCVYGGWTGTGGVYIKRWEGPGNGWSDSVVVSETADARWAVAPPWTPATWDSIPIFYADDVNDSLYVRMMKADWGSIEEPQAPTAGDLYKALLRTQVLDQMR